MDNCKINMLASICKGGVYININPQKSNHESVHEYFNCQRFDDEDRAEIGMDVLNKMIELDRIYEIIAYPETPIGSYTIHHYNIDDALDAAINTIAK